MASVLAEMGALVIASDDLNRDELDAPEVQEVLREWWGAEVMDASGRTDRSGIRRRISGDAEARRRLERLLHPRIAARRRALMAAHEDDPQTRAFVWDSPLLFEAGLAEQCDHVIFVEADEEVRRSRVARERGWTADDLHRLEAAQKPLDMKRARADHTVVNNSDIGGLRRQVEDVFSRILSGD